MLAAAADRPVDGVIAVGDRPVVLAARVAEALGLPWHPPDAARASANKRLARERLAQAGLPAPALHFDDRRRPIRSSCRRRARYPAVVKPVALSGSRGVIRADTPDDARRGVRARLGAAGATGDPRAAHRQRRRDPDRGRSSPAASTPIEGRDDRAARSRRLAVFDKPDPLDGPFFEETIYVTPSRAVPACERAIVDGGAARGGRARPRARAGPRRVPRQSAARDVVYVLEVAARPIGGLCSRVLRFDVGGVARVAGARAAAPRARRRVVAGRAKTGAAAVMMIPIPRRGMLQAVAGEDAARAVPHRRGRADHREDRSAARAAARRRAAIWDSSSRGRRCPSRRKRRCARRTGG